MHDLNRTKRLVMIALLSQTLLSQACEGPMNRAPDRPPSTITAQAPTPTAQIPLTVPATVVPPVETIVLATPMAASCDPPVERITFDVDYSESPSQRMQVLIEADQSARKSSDGDLARLRAADQQRRREIMGYLQEGKINTANDLFYAALIFQHGNCPDHYKLGNLLAEKAMQKGDATVMGGDGAVRWLYAATLDRYLISLGKPQKFGTQYWRPSGRWELYPVDSSTTDHERLLYNVPSLAAAKARAEEMNAKSK